LTASHYADYASLKTRDSLRIVAFPCNQFGAQEPGTPEKIKSFVEGKGLTVNTPESNFKLMGKVDVNGGGEHPVYTFLKKHSYDDDIEWNFTTKFIVKCTGDDVCSISRIDGRDLPSALV
jgi:glutathione peroxidase-family protein